MDLKKQRFNYWMFRKGWGAKKEACNTSLFLKTRLITVQFSSFQFSSVQSLSRVWLFVTPMNRSTPGLPVHHQLLEFTQTHVYRVSDAIQASHPLLSPSLLTPNSSQHQGLFQWVNSSQEVAKVLEFQLQHPILGLISFRMNWLYLLAVQGTLKSLLQHHKEAATKLCPATRGD